MKGNLTCHKCGNFCCRRSVISGVVNQLVWNPVIEKFFQKFIEESDPEIKKQTELLDGFNKLIRKKERELEKTPAEHKEKIERIIDDIKQKRYQLELKISNSPKRPNELPTIEYNEFKKMFFNDRDVSQCVEPVFSRVLGHDRFFQCLYLKRQEEQIL